MSFDKQHLTRAAEAALHPRDGTHTHKGIAKMIEEFNTNGRKGVPWVCIMITDGISKFPEKTIQVAKLAKEKGKTLLISVTLPCKCKQSIFDMSFKLNLAGVF